MKTGSCAVLAVIAGHANAVVAVVGDSHILPRVLCVSRNAVFRF